VASGDVDSNTFTWSVARTERKVWDDSDGRWMLPYLVGTVQFLLSLDQLLLLIGEVDKLVQSFLVDMAVFLQLSIALVQLFEELKNTRHQFVLKNIVLEFLILKCR
jgi:hypothetical protein